MWNLTVIIATVLIQSVFSQSQVTDNCKCVEFYLCKNGTVVTHGGTSDIEERMGKVKREVVPNGCSSCNCTGLTEICCNVPDIRPMKHLNRTIIEGCGHSNPDGVAFKIGPDTSEVVFGEFPWMIAVFEDGKYRCGGSLIHPSVVLTAAHCIKNITGSHTIRAGEWDTSTTNELLKHQDRGVTSIKLHEAFRPKIYYNDVALVFLDEPVELQAHIGVACLVPPDVVVDKGRCYATGWGRDRFDEKANVPVRLKKVELPMVERSECLKNLRQTRLGKYFELHDTFVCAGGEKDKDTCKGDGGGPLVCPIEGEQDVFQQVGIVAWGIGCNDENVPGVYASIAALRKWIDKQMDEKNFDTKQYQFSKA